MKLRAKETAVVSLMCDSVDWYDGTACALPAFHTGQHEDSTGFKWDKGAGEWSVYRVHGPWWPERGHVLSNYVEKD